MMAVGINRRATRPPRVAVSHAAQLMCVAHLRFSPNYARMSPCHDATPTVGRFSAWRDAVRGCLPLDGPSSARPFLERRWIGNVENKATPIVIVGSDDEPLSGRGKAHEGRKTK